MPLLPFMGHFVLPVAVGAKNFLPLRRQEYSEYKYVNFYFIISKIFVRQPVGCTCPPLLRDAPVQVRSTG
jgi:hypothetical protein